VHGAHAGEGQYRIAQIKLPKLPGVERYSQKPERQGKQRKKRHGTQTVSGVQPPGDLYSDDGAEYLKGDRRLDVAPGPAEGFLQRHYQRAERVQRSYAGSGANAEQCQNQYSPTEMELGPIDRGGAARCVVGKGHS